MNSASAPRKSPRISWEPDAQSEGDQEVAKSGLPKGEVDQPSHRFEVALALRVGLQQIAQSHCLEGTSVAQAAIPKIAITGAMLRNIVS
jgi:hypothetical protein